MLFDFIKFVGNKIEEKNVKCFGKNKLLFIENIFWTRMTNFRKAKVKIRVFLSSGSFYSISCSRIFCSRGATSLLPKNEQKYGYWKISNNDGLKYVHNLVLDFRSLIESALYREGVTSGKSCFFEIFFSGFWLCSTGNHNSDFFLGTISHFAEFFILSFSSQFSSSMVIFPFFPHLFLASICIFPIRNLNFICRLNRVTFTSKLLF